MVLNDFSARDVQVHEIRLRLGPAKGKDTATALGTVFVTADELSHRRSPGWLVWASVRTGVEADVELVVEFVGCRFASSQSSGAASCPPTTRA